MIVYLSGLQERYFDLVKSFDGFGVLASFAYPDKYFDYLNNGFSDVMLDSGAFSVFKGKKTIDIDAYVSFVKENSVKLTVNLDVLGDGEKSLGNWQYILSKGVKVMPVYHFNDDISQLYTYVEGTDYVGLSATSMVAQNQMRIYLDKIFSIYPDHKFHLFGCTSIPILTTYPVYSCDSTSWQNGTRMGWVITRYGNYFLNKNKKDIPLDVEKFLRDKYNLGILNDYETTAKFGEAINRVNISELNYLLCNHKEKQSRPVMLELF